MTGHDARVRRHPDLDFHMDVRWRPYTRGTWTATADLGGDHDVGMGREPREAIRGALSALGERYAREMARDADTDGVLDALMDVKD